MSESAPTNGVSAAPFEVYSVHFDFPGGHAIRLKDPATNQFIGISPEWVNGSKNELAAFVRGTRPEMQVVFRGTPNVNGTYTIGADGTPIQVDEQQVTLAFDPQSGLSTPQGFRASSELPNEIGLHPTNLHWYVREQPAPVHCPQAGTTTHQIATSWRTFAKAPDLEDGLPNWVFSPLMEWTCQWAAGQNDEKEICDAIISNLGSSGLQYGVQAHDVREMLLKQGGMCGVWYQAFQQMAHCQGIFVYRRRFLVDWRTISSP